MVSRCVPTSLGIHEFSLAWVAHTLRATDLIISGGSWAHDRVILPL